MPEARRILSISTRLMVIIALVCCVAVILACAGFGAYEVVSYRQSAVDGINTLADIIGENCGAALTFDDSAAAREVLNALKHEPHVAAACVFRKGDKKPFASYVRHEKYAGQIPDSPRINGNFFEDGMLKVSRSIILERELVGYVYICNDMAELRHRLERYIAISAIIGLAAITVSLLVGRYFQRMISRPVHELAEKIGTVSRERDYTVRAYHAADDELGVLFRGFNEMLEQIQARDGELVRARDTLEDRVRERTAELEEEIAERLRAEANLKKIAQELTRSNAELQQFAFVASHDLQEPLRKIVVFGDRLASKCGATVGEQGMEYLRRMQNAAGRMQTLINDLLTYSRVTTRAQPFAVVDLEQVVCEVLIDLEVRVEKEGGKVELGRLPVVEADATQLRQLFQNLIGNALKYRRKETPPLVNILGAVRPAAGGDTPRELRAGEVAELVVADNGIGFEQKHAERIFKVFQRLHGRDEYEGSGVGLAVCRKIVDRHGGTIRAEGVPGQGAKFIVTLPLRQPAAV